MMFGLDFRCYPYQMNTESQKKGRQDENSGRLALKGYSENELGNLLRQSSFGVVPPIPFLLSVIFRHILTKVR